MNEKTSSYMLEFLGSHEELVNQDNWDAIYALYYEDYNAAAPLTTYLHALGFDPLPYMTSIPGYMYYHCDWLEEITIHDSVTSIGFGVFYKCLGLTSVTIGSSVESLGYYAFCGCDKLTNIYFNGTISQWQAIEKGTYWNTNVPATVVCCKDGDVEL